MARTPQSPSSQLTAGRSGTESDLHWRDLLKNQPALIGFLLSMLQVVVHATWIGLIWYLTQSGQAAVLNDHSWQSWLMVGLLGLGLILTGASMFVCLYFGLRRSPRTLAVIGFFVSFFFGTLATALVFMTAIRAMSGG
jgi:hypothetical protein